MTILTFPGHIARHFRRARNLHRLQREIARYPESVRTDIGWPSLVRHPDELLLKHITNRDDRNEFNSFD